MVSTTENIKIKNIKLRGQQIREIFAENKN